MSPNFWERMAQCALQSFPLEVALIQRMLYSEQTQACSEECVSWRVFDV